MKSKCNLSELIIKKMTTAKAVVIRLIIVIYYRLYDYFFVDVAVANAANCSTAPLLAITFAP